MLNLDPRAIRFFYGTAEQPCPYVPSRMESKAVTELTGPGAARLHEVSLGRAGDTGVRPEPAG